MRSAQKQMKRRPGFWIPVFFLSLVHTQGQSPPEQMCFPEPGGCFAARPGAYSTMQNQAGLGRIRDHSLTLLHARPFLLGELGISSFCAQFCTGEGTLGASYTTFGLPGFRHSEVWVSYGMGIYEGLCAGLGIHLWNTGIQGEIIHHPGASFALGLQARVNEKLVLGAHLYHPAGWFPDGSITGADRMVISAGGSYTFFRKVTFYTNLQFPSNNRPAITQGIELEVNEKSGFYMGLLYRPFSLAGGLWLRHGSWLLSIAYAYWPDAGSTPSSSITYAW